MVPYSTYKIDDVVGRGEYSVSSPELDEILKDIDFCGVFSPDYETLITDPDFLARAEESVRSSSFFDLLTETAYAAEDEEKTDVDLDFSYNDKSLKYKVTFTLMPGKTPLFELQELKDISVKFVISGTFMLDVAIDFKSLSDFYVAAKSTNDITYKIEILLAGLPKESNKDRGAIATAIARKIEESVNTFSSDNEAKGEFKLFGASIPTPVPIFLASFDIFITTEFEGSIKLNVTRSMSSTSVTVYRFFFGIPQKYCGVTEKERKQTTLNLCGKLGLEAGPRLELGIEIFDDKVFDLSIFVECGFYIDLFAAGEITLGNDKPLGVYIEMGRYFDVGLSVKFLSVKGEFKIYEFRKPFDNMKIGSAVLPYELKAVPSSVSIDSDGYASMPVFKLECYDVKKGARITKTIQGDSKELVLTAEDGTVLKHDSRKIILPAGFSSVITATYNNEGYGVSCKLALMIGDSSTEQKDAAVTPSVTSVPEVFNTAPTLTVYDTDGNIVSLSDMLGKPVVLNFWTSWCSPSKREFPYFNTMYYEYGDEIEFMMVNHSTNDNISDAEILCDAYSFPCCFDYDGGSSVFIERYIPLTYFIDENGNVLDIYTGAMSEDQLRSYIETLFY